MHPNHDSQYRELLLNYLQEKKKKNPLFSLRSLAKQLQISPAQLSQFISGKRPLTLRVAMQIADKLEFSSLERQQMLASLQGGGRKRIVKKVLPNYEIINEDQLKVISEWYYFAILALADLTENQTSPTWIAKRLNIDVHTARDAYERLKRLNYIQESNDQFRQSSRPLHTTSDVPSSTIRKCHRQNLDLASQKLDEIEIHQREFTSITVSTNPKKLKRAKELMNSFKNDLALLLGNGETSEVYTLALQLFPVTTLKENEG